MDNIYIDPRGPIRTIIEVGEYRRATSPNVFGGCIPVTLSCGHVAEMNFTFSYRVGENCRCLECKKAS